MAFELFDLRNVGKLNYRELKVTPFSASNTQTPVIIIFCMCLSQWLVTNWL